MTCNKACNQGCNSKFSIGVTTNQPIQIDSTVAKTCIETLGLCGSSSDLSNENIIMQIRKAGTLTHLLEYEALEMEDGSVCFYWDNLLYELGEGRYIGDLFSGREGVAEVQFEINNSVSLGTVTNTTRTREVDCD